MSQPTLDANWKRWIAENLNRGCTVQSMVQAMVDKGWNPELALNAINTRAPFEHAMPEWAKQSTIPCSDGRAVRVLQSVEKPQILLLEDVLSGAECDELIRRAIPRLRASTTVDRQSGAYKVIKERTSQSAYFRNDDDFMNRINTRLADLMHVPLENGEDLQIVKYVAGGEYKSHWDYFPLGDPGSASEIANGGQRTSTLIVYLNHVSKGGSTAFPKINLRVHPRKGNGLYFHYFDAHGQVDEMSLHAGEPVGEGEKWIITKWMRSGRRT
jgi:prolyl 4-hydroxylase